MAEPKKMERPKEEPEEGAPGWMVTFGDMNMILLVFFILMYSLLSLEKPNYITLKAALKAISMTGKVKRVSAAKDPTGETAERAFKAIESSERAVTAIRQIAGVHVRLQRIPEGTVLTLGGETESFEEGSWTLLENHKKVLDEVKKYLVRKKRYIEVRGHTSGNLRDSVILDTEADGSIKVRKFNKDDLKRKDRAEISNHWMLGWLRANEVRKYLLEPFPDGEPGIVESRVRIRSDAYTHPMERSDRPLYDIEGKPLRAKNHRVEVILTNEVEKGE